jgi:hypothetical protein
MTTSSAGYTSSSSTSNTSSTNTSNANNNAAPTPTTPTMNTDYTKTVNVKKVPFDVAEASFYLWTTQILGFAESNNFVPVQFHLLRLFSVMHILMNISCYRAEEPTAEPLS